MSERERIITALDATLRTYGIGPHANFVAYRIAGEWHYAELPSLERESSGAERGKHGVESSAEVRPSKK